MNNNEEKRNLVEKIVALAKRRGLIYPGSEIYGGLAGTWDYGPTGTELKNNIKREFWKSVVYAREDVVGVDAAIMMNPRAWEASGHVEAFTDPLVECKICHKRFRADKEDEIKEHEDSVHKGETVEWTPPQKFNLLVSAYLGVLEDEKQEIYLRGEITNGVQVNFKNVVDSTRVKIPFGIAQIGKAFRNEITPGNFTFRSREFEQMELQFYIKPDDDEGEKWFEYWKKERMDWFLSLGFKEGSLRFRDHEDKERAHYAKAACDVEYNAPWGWSELAGVHNRGDFDLKRHQEYSKQSMSYHDQENNDEYIPWDIETSAGVDRTLLFLLFDSYTEDGERIYLKLPPKLAPYKAAVFPLVGNKEEIMNKAKDVYSMLKEENILPIVFDGRGNIGKRYFSQDEIGTPYCITVDYDTLEDDTVTVRDRDTAEQERIKVSELAKLLQSKLA